MNTFTETQHFRQWWVWTLLGVVFLIVTVPLFTSEAGNDPFAWGGPVVVVLVSMLMYIWRLDTRLDTEGIHYHVFPLLPWRTIPWQAVESVSVCQYGFVGYGIRWGFDGWVYNVAGNKGLRVVFPDKKQITIGTQRPDDIQAFLTVQETLLKN